MRGLVAEAPCHPAAARFDDVHGEVSAISTDTCTFTREQKAMWQGDWTKIPMGMPGLDISKLDESELLQTRGW